MQSFVVILAPDRRRPEGMLQSLDGYLSVARTGLRHIQIGKGGDIGMGGRGGYLLCEFISMTSVLKVQLSTGS